jgi:hypothetical protein
MIFIFEITNKHEFWILFFFICLCWCYLLVNVGFLNKKMNNNKSRNIIEVYLIKSFWINE